MEYIFTTGLNDAARYIREEVFIKEQHFQNEFDDLDEISYHLVITKKNHPVATGRFYKKNDDYIIGRVAVLKSYRKNHYGQDVMDLLEKKIKELGGTHVVLSAQVQASGFYEKRGYQKTGEQYLDEYCPHIKMIKNLK